MGCSQLSRPPGSLVTPHPTSAKTLRVSDRATRQILRKRIKFLDGAIEQLKLEAKSWPTTFRQRFHQIVEHGAHAPRDLKVLRSVKANFPTSQLHEIIPVRSRENHPQATGVVRDLLVVQVLLPTSRSKR